MRRAARVEKYSRDVCDDRARAGARRGAGAGRVKTATGTNACDARVDYLKYPSRATMARDGRERGCEVNINIDACVWSFVSHRRVWCARIGGIR